eukprot:1149144-Pelagomonas_calceolata.AAC.2
MGYVGGSRGTGAPCLDGLGRELELDFWGGEWPAGLVDVLCGRASPFGCYDQPRADQPNALAEGIVGVPVRFMRISLSCGSLLYVLGIYLNDIDCLAEGVQGALT